MLPLVLEVLVVEVVVLVVGIVPHWTVGRLSPISPASRGAD